MQLELSSPTDFDTWRTQARWLAAREVPPADVQWRVHGQVSLLDEEPTELEVDATDALKVPRAFVELARTVILHREPARFALLYRVLLRLKHEPRLLSLAIDPDIARLRHLEKQVHHDQHRMHAYVRFRKVLVDGAPQFIAWYAPEHHIVEATADFFVRRFAGQHWAILTPERSAVWDGRSLAFGPGVPKHEAPDEDSLESLWKTYYASTFNPARVNVAALQTHMPRKFWSQLPEAQLIAPLVHEARARTGQMVDAPIAPARRARTVPLKPITDSNDFKAQLDACRRCPIGVHATQGVPGEGPAHATLMFVGEQPGDQEDLAGRPFVGPAGQLFDRALAEAGIDRAQVYVTNAVKHFKFEAQITPRGKRRLHKKPGEQEIAACEQWLQHELQQVAPTRLIALGATAARALLGRAVAINAVRGQWLALHERQLLVTVHPSYLLRIAPAQFDAEYARFVADLRKAAS
jgi:DNA polymerase